MDSQLNPPPGETLQNQPPKDPNSSEPHSKSYDQKDLAALQGLPSSQKNESDMNPPTEGKISDPNRTQTPKQGIKNVQDPEKTSNKDKELDTPAIEKEKESEVKKETRESSIAHPLESHLRHVLSAKQEDFEKSDVPDQKDEPVTNDLQSSQQTQMNKIPIGVILPEQDLVKVQGSEKTPDDDQKNEPVTPNLQKSQTKWIPIGVIYPEQVQAQAPEKTPKKATEPNTPAIEREKELETKKEKKEIYIESSDLLPEGVESVEELKRMFEEKRNLKRSNHLDCIPKVHQGDVLCAMFSPDYKYIVSGSADRSIKILDAETKQEVYHIKEAHEESVKTIAMTSDMKYLVSGSQDKSIKIFDFMTKQPLHHFKDAHEHPITSLTITPDNRYIISGSQKGSVKMFGMAFKQEAYHFTNIREKVKVTPNNSSLIIGTSDGSLTIFDLLTKQKSFVFEAKDFGVITSMAITSDSNSIIAGCGDGSIKALNISENQGVEPGNIQHASNIKILLSEKNQVTQIVLNSDSQDLFAGFSDGSILRWNAKMRHRQILQGVSSAVTQLAVSQKADFLIACTAKQPSIHLIDVQPKEKNAISLQNPRQGQVPHNQIGLAISPDSKYIFSAMASKSIKVIDAETKQQVFQNSFTCDSVISSVAITPDGKFIIAGLHNGCIKIFDFRTKQAYFEFQPLLRCVITRIAVTPDSRYIIANGKDHSLIMFDITEKKLVHTFSNVHKETITGVSVTPDNKFVVSASYDKSIKIFDLVTKKEVHHFQDVHKGEIYTLTLTPNGKFIVSAARDFSIKIFDIETKHLIYEFVYAHDNSIFGLAISSDSRYVASNSADNSAKVFDLETKQLVYSLQNLHSNWGWALAFAPNDKYLVSVALDDSMKFIDFETVMLDGHLRSNGWKPIKALATSPDNRLVVSCSQHFLEGWNVRTKHKVFETVIDGYESGKFVVFSSDSKLVIYGTEKGSIGVFDVESKKKLSTFKNIHNDRVYALVVTPDDRFIISGSQDKSIKIIHRKTGEIYHHFKDIHQETVRSLKVTPDGRYLISASADKTIKIIDIEEKKQVYHFNAHPRWIKCIDVSSNGKFLVSCSDDRSIKIFDFKTKQLVHWFKNAHDDFINSIAISQDCRFIVSGSADESIKVFDIQTQQQVHHFKKIHTNTIRHVAITSDNKYIISASYDGYIKFFRLTLTLSDNEIYYVYNGLSHYLNFNAVDDFLFNPNIPIKSAYATAINCQNLTVYPYKWNILHLLAIRAQHAFLKNLPEYSQFKVPFLLDAFGKTPLHYLIAHEKINSASVNFMLNYICDYLEGLTKYQRYQAQEIIISLTPLFWFILTKTDIKVRERFLNICSVPIPVPYTAELPAFGAPKTDIASFHPTLESIYSSINNLWENGEDQIDFRTNIVNLDYDVLSNDMNKTVKCLSKQKNEEVFKTTLIIDLINHLWDQTKLFLQVKFLIVSAYILALSVYLSLQDRSLPYEIIVLCCAGVFFFAEVLQMITLKKDYVKDPWNWIDIIFHPLTIAYVIARMLGTEDELVRAWISTVILLLGYLRWISYLRIFKPTRNLIQVVVTVVNDMKSFIIIIALIIIGFSFIFLVFNRGRLYGFYLYNAYGSLYGPVDDGESSPSEQFFIALIAFLLNVILLNLLISIMGDSYAKVLEKRIKTDSLTRLDMISEAVTFLRFLRRKKAQQRGFLVLCESLNSTGDGDDNDARDEWEERIVVLKNLLKQSENSTQKEMKVLQHNLARIEEKRKDNEEKLQQKVSSLETELQEKMNKMLTLLTEMKGQGVKQPQSSTPQSTEAPKN